MGYLQLVIAGTAELSLALYHKFAERRGWEVEVGRWRLEVGG